MKVLLKKKKTTHLRSPTRHSISTKESVPIAVTAKPCVANLDIAMINKFYDLATMQPKVPATVQSHYELLEHKASECIGCHACESRCPFEYRSQSVWRKQQNYSAVK